MRALFSGALADLMLLVVLTSGTPTLRERNANHPSATYTHDLADNPNSEDDHNNATSGRFHRLDVRAEQEGAGWGLTYISSKQKHLTYNAYYFDESGGAGVDVYVVDSGVNDIAGFGGRLVDLINVTDQPSEDIDNHGTAVASVIGSDKYGVAKKVNLFSVKVFQGSNFPQKEAVDALKKITKLHNERKTEDTFKGSIISMSFEFWDERRDEYKDLEPTLKEAHEAGISIVGSAGNDGDDAEFMVPCNSPWVICVGAIDPSYRLAKFTKPGSGSNYGSDVTLLAPGWRISTYSNKGVYELRSGTSLAVPFVTAILAIIYGIEGKLMNPTLARQRLLDNADEGYIEGELHGTPNILANTGYQKAPPGLPYIGAPRETCTTHYWVILDTFNIHLSDFPNGDFNCASLKKQVSGCGDLHDWKCNPHADSPYTYEASGRLPIGIQHKGCIARAIVSAGGPDIDKSCSGTA